MEAAAESVEAPEPPAEVAPPTTPPAPVAPEEAADEAAVLEAAVPPLRREVDVKPVVAPALSTVVPMMTTSGVAPDWKRDSEGMDEASVLSSVVGAPLTSVAMARTVAVVGVGRPPAPAPLSVALRGAVAVYATVEPRLSSVVPTMTTSGVAPPAVSDSAGTDEASVLSMVV